MQMLIMITIIAGLLSENGNIRGTVVHSETLMPNAHVRLLDPVDQSVVAETITDNTGQYGFANIKAGGYFISIKMNDIFREHADSVNVPAGSTINVGTHVLRLNPFPDDLFEESRPSRPQSDPPMTDIRHVYGALTMTVCEYVRLQPRLFTYKHPFNIILIGTIMQTPQGSWIQQTCTENLKSGEFVWPNAIALKAENDEAAQALIKRSSLWQVLPGALSKPTINEIAPIDEGRQWIAVYGKLDTRDNMVAVTCGKGQLCGYGFGPINAPAQLIFGKIHYFYEK